jgi:hypothetical protein
MYNLLNEGDLRLFAAREAIPLVFELDEVTFNKIANQEAVLILFVKETDTFLKDSFKDSAKRLGQ